MTEQDPIIDRMVDAMASLFYGNPREPRKALLPIDIAEAICNYCPDIAALDRARHGLLHEGDGVAGWVVWQPETAMDDETRSECEPAIVIQVREHHA